MRTGIKHAVRILLVLVLGGFLGATLVRFSPGFGLDEEALDSRLNSVSHAALRAQSRADDSLPHFYLEYWTRLLHGDLGTSIAMHQPVRQLLADRIPETAKTVAFGLALAWTFGLGMAFASLVPRMRWVGWGASLVCSLILCVPAAVVAILFILVQAPVRLAVGIVVLPRVYEFARGVLVRTAALPHVLAARARGLSDFRILLEHIVRVAAPQIAALFGVTLCAALAACVPMEALCDSPGIGQLAWKAALGRDLPLLVNLTLLVTLITLAANLTADAMTEARLRDKQP